MTTPSGPSGRSAADRFTDRFGTRRAVFAVVHVLDESQMLANVDVAVSAGCDGVFLVNHDHGAEHSDLIAFSTAVRAAHRGFFVGINALDASAEEMLSRAPADLEGVWADDAGVWDATGPHPAAEENAVTRGNWGGFYFGSVAFKYQRHVDDPAAVAAAAAPFMDVVTTSGSGTGSAPEVDKLASMRAALGGHPFAVASGITPDNAELLAVHVDAVLVATGVSADFHHLDPVKVRELVETIDSLGDRTW